MPQHPDPSVDPAPVEPDVDPTPDALSDEPSEKLVPVTEAIRYRKRAQSAEQRLGELERQLHEAQQQLDDARKAVTSLERRQRIDALLADADTVDLDAARLLTEAAVAQMDEPDLELAVADLRRHKPYLFRPRRDDDRAATMSPRVSDTHLDAVERAAEHAITTGDRRDLLRYLRLRRDA